MQTTSVGNRRTSLIAACLLLSVGGLLTGCGTRSAAATGAYAAAPVAPSPVAPSSMAVAAYGTGDDTSGECPADGVVLRAGEANAALGLRVLTVELTDCGTEPYTLDGYPTVRLLDREQQPLDLTVGHGAAPITVIEGFDAGPVPLTLRPGESAQFGVVWRNTVDASDEAPVNGGYLEIVPRPGARAHRVPALLDLGTTGRLGISAWSGLP
ncbi:DUF4232 domain-containing protein [Kitasatospora sp. HPMI-4]|uniref:DUF4232 domain-containing protein n=1 Tax=Kitasatospora sp. HPMI-4 TaxID=3448443 RepID=UPI003F1ABEB6